MKAGFSELGSSAPVGPTASALDRTEPLKGSGPAEPAGRMMKAFICKGRRLECLQHAHSGSKQASQSERGFQQPITVALVNAVFAEQQRSSY